jgi:hypothetical protein
MQIPKMSIPALRLERNQKKFLRLAFNVSINDPYDIRAA